MIGLRVPRDRLGSDDESAWRIATDDCVGGSTVRLATQPSIVSRPVTSEVDPTRPSFFVSAAGTFGANVAVAVLSLGNVLITSRALGATGRGEIALLTTIALLSANVALLGVQEANANLAGREPRLRPSLLTNSVLLAAFLGACAALIVAAVIALSPSLGGGVSVGARWVALAAIPVLVLQAYVQLLAQASYGFRVTNLAWLFAPLVNVFVNGALALFGVLSVQSVVATWVAGQVVATALVVRFAVRAYGFGRPSGPVARRSLAFGLKSHLGRVMMLGNYRLDQWILGVVAGPRELGVYSVAVVWSETLFFLPTALTSVQRPDLVRASADRAASVVAPVFRACVIVTVGLGLALFALAPALCIGLFGEEFRDSTIDLRILVFGAVGMVALKQLGGALTAQRRPLLASSGIGIALLTTIALDFALIPQYGALGAAIASSVAYTAGGLAMALIFRRVFSDGHGLIPRLRDLRKLVQRLWLWASRLASRS